MANSIGFSFQGKTAEEMRMCICGLPDSIF